MRHAAFISGSFMSGRPASSSARSATKAVVRSMTKPITDGSADCRTCFCRKGKCKEQALLEAGQCLIVDSPRFAPALRRAAFTHTHGNLRRFRRLFTSSITHIVEFRTSPSFTMFSRGIASAASIPKRQSATLSSTEATMHRRPGLLDLQRDLHHASLEELWDTFSAFREEDIRELDTHELLNLGGTILKGTARRDPPPSPSEWGWRIERFLVELKKRTPFKSPIEIIQLECLSTVVQALQDHPSYASASLSDLLEKEPSLGEQYRWALDTFKHVLWCLLRKTSAQDALEMYGHNSLLLKRFLGRGLADGKSRPQVHAQFVPELLVIFREMDSPAEFVGLMRHWHMPHKLSLGATMIHALCEEGLPEDALAVYEELRRQGVIVRYPLEHALVRALAKARRYERATTFYLDIAPKEPNEAWQRSYICAGLHLFAHSGNVERAEECFENLSANGGVSSREMTLVMQASAVAGDTARVEDLFKSFFGDPDEGPGPGSQKPNVFHYSTVVNAYARRDNVAGMNRWLGHMLRAGCSPDLATYNVVLKGVAQRDDFRSVEALLDQMREQGISPSVKTYTTLMKVLARRRDVLATEALFKRMRREGITLDRIAVTTLMNAHVEAGNWRGVIHVFDFIDEAKIKDLKLGVEVFNTLLKAYVLVGTPLDIVSNLMRKAERMNVKPTNRTYALLIQAACDSGRMEVATKLFTQMEELEEDWTSHVKVTKEVMTIIISAYLRLGNRVNARNVYEEMQRRGIQPTAYTYASILRSYSNVDFEENLRIAREFLDSLVSESEEKRDWVEPGSGRDGSIAFVFAPLLNAYTKRVDVETAEKLYQKFIDNNEKPTVGILGLLMDAYRRAGDIQSVQRVWREIYDTAMNRTDEIDKLLNKTEAEDKFFRSRRRGDLLCIPLSIYIDALSQAGKHIEIAHTWNALRESGFQFDAHNWNHLVIALVRAGQPQRAFDVVEKVLLPYQMQSLSMMRSRAKKEKVDSPLFFDNQETRAETESEPYLNKSSRSIQKRPRLLERLRRRFRTRHGRLEAEDFTQELQLISQISPEWNVWRPHEVTLRILARVLDRLESGRFIRPSNPRRLRPSPDDADSDVDSLVEEEYSDEFYEPPPSEEETQEAHKVLSRILTEYPETIMLINKWESDTARAEKKESRQMVRQTTYDLRDMDRTSY